MFSKVASVEEHVEAAEAKDTSQRSASWRGLVRGAIQIIPKRLVNMFEILVERVWLRSRFIEGFCLPGSFNTTWALSESHGSSKLILV